jgi:hypothetical protein
MSSCLIKLLVHPAAVVNLSLSVQHLLSYPSHNQGRSSLPSIPSLINDPINIDSTLSYLKAMAFTPRYNPEGIGANDTQVLKRLMEGKKTWVRKICQYTRYTIGLPGRD